MVKGSFACTYGDETVGAGRSAAEATGAASTPATTVPRPRVAVTAARRRSRRLMIPLEESRWSAIGPVSRLCTGSQLSACALPPETRGVRCRIATRSCRSTPGRNPCAVATRATTRETVGAGRPRSRRAGEALLGAPGVLPAHPVVQEDHDHQRGDRDDPDVLDVAAVIADQEREDRQR